MHPAFASPRASDPRGFFARAWADPDTRSVLIGVVGVLLVHLLLWLVAPHVLRIDAIEVPLRPHASAKQFNIELAPETFAKTPPPKPKQPFKFVETNPDAPENTPDKTENFSNRNQQVAQEKPTPDGKSDRPALEGSKERESTAIVTGQLNKPIEHQEAVPPTPQEMPQPQPAATIPKAEQNPLPGFEKKQGEERDSFGSNVARFPDNVRPIPERIEGDKNAPLVQGVEARPVINRARPQPRPQLVETQNVRPAFLAENKFGTKNIGRVAVDGRWSAYGEYLQRMIEAIDVHWHNLLFGNSAVPQSGTYVTVKFILDSEGKIARIVTVDSHTSPQGVQAACSAITDRAPYGLWTDDMKALLGEQQEMTFTFYYD